jgi:hypothetical protein
LRKDHIDICGMAKQNAAFGFMVRIIKSSRYLAIVTSLWFFLCEIGLRYYLCVLMQFLVLFSAHGNTLEGTDKLLGVMTEGQIPEGISFILSLFVCL